MKSFRTTIIFALLVAALGGFVYWDHQKNQADEAAKEKQALIFSYGLSEVTEVSLKSPKHDILLKKEADGNWRLLKPVEDEADSETLKTWLGELLAQKGKDLTASVKAENSGQIDWTKYFLTPESLVLKVSTASETSELQFGTSNAFDGSYFLRQGDKLLLGDVSWGGVIERNPKAFRNRDLYEPKADIVGFLIERPGRKNIKLEVQDKKWVMVGRNFALSDFNLASFIDDVKKLKATEIVADELSKENLNKYNLTKPVMVLSIFEDKNATPYKLYVGNRKPNEADVFVYTSRQPTIYRASGATFDKVIVTEDSFRDGRAPFKVDITQVDKVRVKVQGVERLFEKTGETWKATKLGPNEDFNPAKMQSFLARIQDLDARLFLGKKDIGPQAGVEDIELMSGGKTLLNISMGEEFTSPDVASNINPMRYIKTNLTPEVLAVRSVSPQLIMQQLPVTPKGGQNEEDSLGSDPSVEALRSGEDSHSH